MKRANLQLDFDALFVSVEWLLDSRLLRLFICIVNAFNKEEIGVASDDVRLYSVNNGIHYPDFKTNLKQIISAFQAGNYKVVTKAWALFDLLHIKRFYIRLVRVIFSSSFTGNYQISLINDTRLTSSLYQVLNIIRNKFVSRNFNRASKL